MLLLLNDDQSEHLYMAGQAVSQKLTEYGPKDIGDLLKALREKKPWEIRSSSNRELDLLKLFASFGMSVFFKLPEIQNVSVELESGPETRDLPCESANIAGGAGEIQTES